MAELAGIDVSSWQGSPFWSSVDAAGIKFACCKATEGDGLSVDDGGRDKSFAYNWKALRATNIQQGAYHFARPSLGNQPEVGIGQQWKVRLRTVDRGHEGSSRRVR